MTPPLGRLRSLDRLLSAPKGKAGSQPAPPGVEFERGGFLGGWKWLEMVFACFVSFFRRIFWLGVSFFLFCL